MLRRIDRSVHVMHDVAVLERRIVQRHNALRAKECLEKVVRIDAVGIVSRIQPQAMPLGERLNLPWRQTEILMADGQDLVEAMLVFLGLAEQRRTVVTDSHSGAFLICAAGTVESVIDASQGIQQYFLTSLSMQHP